MDKEAIVNVITGHACVVVPKLEDYQFQADDSLRDLGANSIDRSEIIMMTLETLSLRTPLIDFAEAENIQELAEIFLEKFQSTQSIQSN